MIERLVAVRRDGRPRRALPPARARRAARGGTAARRLRDRRCLPPRTWTTRRSGGSAGERLEEHARRRAGGRPRGGRALASLPSPSTSPTPASVASLVEPEPRPGRGLSCAAAGALPGGRRRACEGRARSREPDRPREAVRRGASRARLRSTGSWPRRSGPAGEQAVFRVDHVLGMPTVQNLLALRFANRVLETVWSGDHIEQVEILWEETLALEGRAGYYDRPARSRTCSRTTCSSSWPRRDGAYRPDAAAQDLHDRKLDALRSVRPLTLPTCREDSPRPLHRRPARDRRRRSRLRRRGRRGRRSARPRRSPRSSLSSTARAGPALRFVLRAGKALDRRRKMAIVGPPRRRR